MAAASTHNDDASTMREEVDRLKADLQRLRLDMSHFGGDAMHAAKAGVAEAKERVSDAAHAAAKKGKESLDAVESQVATHPFASLGAAFAVGMVIGLGLSRRH